MIKSSSRFTRNLEAKPLPKVNEWQHVTGTYDGAKMKIYLNGKVIGENADKFDFQGTNDAPLRIGGSKDRPQYTFNGTIDEVVIYSRALDAGEINNVMKSGPSAVSQEGKLSTTWAGVKSQ